MQIDPRNNVNLSGLAPSANASADSAKSANKASTPAPPVTTFSRTPELEGLLHQLRQLPDVRPEVVSRASDQLRSGELSTPEAALQTAQSILKTGFPAE